MRNLADRAISLLLTLLASSTSVASQSLREAARLDEEGRCEEAERHYRALLAQGSPSGALLNNAGNHYLICGQSDKAHEYFERILRTNPTHGNANFQLARMAVEQRQGSKALEYLARVKSEDPQILLVRAEALHWTGQKPASSSILDGLEKAAVRDAPMLFLLGLSCARLGMYERAEAAFNRALSLQPGDFDITFALGRSAARAEHYERAQSALEAALRLRPGDMNVLVELGRVSAARQDYVRAVFHLAQARKKAPENADILLLLARAAEDAGYYEDAANAYDEYLRVRPGEDAVRRDRARAYGQTESRLEQASKEIEWYLARHADDAQGHYIAAQIVWAVKPDQALHHLTEAVRLDPESVSIRFSRAWMLQHAGQMAESLTDLEVARRLAPDNVRILDLIGLAHLALDRPADAEKVLRVALAKSPDEPEVIMHLGRALMALGRETEAQTYMEKYRAIRPQALPGLRKRFGMIELATLTAAEQRRREIDRLRRESRDHPDRPDYQLRLSSLLLADGRNEEALQEFRRLLTLNPESEVLEEAGSVLLTAGESKLARECLERAATNRPSARLDLAVAIYQMEGAPAALKVFDALPPSELTGDALLLKASILELAGRRAEAEVVLNEGLRHASMKPRVIEQAVLLLVRLEREAEGLKLLEQAIRAHPQSGLLLLKAIVLALMDRSAAAEKTLRDIELRWPEWDRAYLVHGLVSESSGRTKDARQKLQTAAALGSKDPALTCALARLSGDVTSAPECTCARGLEQLLFKSCAP